MPIDTSRSRPLGLHGAPEDTLTSSRSLKHEPGGVSAQSMAGRNMRSVGKIVTWKPVKGELVLDCREGDVIRAAENAGPNRVSVFQFGCWVVLWWRFPGATCAGSCGTCFYR